MSAVTNESACQSGEDMEEKSRCLFQLEYNGVGC